MFVNTVLKNPANGKLFGYKEEGVIMPGYVTASEEEFETVLVRNINHLSSMIDKIGLTESEFESLAFEHLAKHGFELQHEEESKEQVKEESAELFEEKTEPAKGRNKKK